MCSINKTQGPSVFRLSTKNAIYTHIEAFLIICDHSMAAPVTNNTVEDPIGRELDQEIENLRSQGMSSTDLLHN